MSSSEEGFSKMLESVNKWAQKYPGLAQAMLTSKFNLKMKYVFEFCNKISVGFNP